MIKTKKNQFYNIKVIKNFKIMELNLQNDLHIHYL